MGEGRRFTCHLCGRELDVAVITEERAAAVGLVYLMARCVPCAVRLEAAGLGRDVADDELERALERRRAGFDPRIKPHPGVERKRWRPRH
jgi:hypothetical protein